MQTEKDIDQDGNHAMKAEQRSEQGDEVQGYSDGTTALGSLASFVLGGAFGLVSYTSYVVVKDATK